MQRNRQKVPKYPISNLNIQNNVVFYFKKSAYIKLKQITLFEKKKNMGFYGLGRSQRYL